MSNNLDFLAAKYSQQLVNSVSNEVKDKLDNAVTKMLGILQANGVYGFFLFARSRTKDEKKICEIADCKAVNLLKEVFQIGTTEEIKSLENISIKFCCDPYDNSLAQMILERYLIYARYHAKAEKPAIKPENELEQQEG